MHLYFWKKSSIQLLLDQTLVLTPFFFLAHNTSHYLWICWNSTLMIKLHYIAKKILEIFNKVADQLTLWPRCFWTAYSNQLSRKFSQTQSRREIFCAKACLAEENRDLGSTTARSQPSTRTRLEADSSQCVQVAESGHHGHCCPVSPGAKSSLDLWPRQLWTQTWVLV